MKKSLNCEIKWNKNNFINGNNNIITCNEQEGIRELITITKKEQANTLAIKRQEIIHNILFIIIIIHIFFL